MVEKIDVDNHKLMYHPKRVGEWLEKGDCYPIYIEIGPTNKCNHDCIFCCYDFYVNHNRLEIDREVMLNALKDMGDKGVKSIMFAGDGEPLLHKDICEFVETAKANSIDVSITSNGSLFTEEKIKRCMPHLSWIRFSIDAGTPETHAKIHRTTEEDFNKIIENIRNAVKFKNKNNLKTVIGIQFLLIPQNAEEVIQLVKIAKEIGVDNLQIKPYSQHPDSINKFVIDYNDYLYLEPELTKFNSDNFKVIFRKQTMKRIGGVINYPQCYGLSFFTLIDAKGNLFPCGLFYNNPDFIYGNLNEKSFSEIWTGEQRKEIIEKMKQRGVQGCKDACRLDVINRYLYRLKKPSLHDNFI